MWNRFSLLPLCSLVGLGDPGVLPWMSGKDLAGLHSITQGPAGLDLLPTQAHFYITSGLASVPASLSWTRHCINHEQMIFHPSRKMFLGRRGGGRHTAIPVLWSTAEEFLGRRWGRRYVNAQARC